MSSPSRGRAAEPDVFAPLAFTRRKQVEKPGWVKTILPRACYEKYRPLLNAGNHGFIQQNGKELPPREDLSPRLYYAHYPCRGKDHYFIKNAHGWLACYSNRDWVSKQLVVETDPGKMYPPITLRYTARYERKRPPIVSLLESALSVAELLRESYAREEELKQEKETLCRETEEAYENLCRELEEENESLRRELEKLKAARA